MNDLFFYIYSRWFLRDIFCLWFKRLLNKSVPSPLVRVETLGTVFFFFFRTKLGDRKKKVRFVNQETEKKKMKSAEINPSQSLDVQYIYNKE